MTATFEATAPCRVDLATAPVAVSVAIDRRAWCRVETGVDGVAVESKDTLQRVQVGRAADLDAPSGPLAVAREALRALGVDAGVRVVTQMKVPSASGLGAETALAVALVGALAQALGRDVTRADVQRLASDATSAALGEAVSAADVAAAVYGGCVTADAASGPARLAVDPATVEECLLLVEAGSAGETSGTATRDPDGHGARVRAALLGRRLDDLAWALAEDWATRCRVPGWTTPERERVAGLLRPAGAGLRACGGGRGTVVAVVAPPGSRGPGRREAVVAAAKHAALRLFPARLDLLGLDVEKAA